MSGGITVSAFKHIPGQNDAEYIKLLEQNIERQEKIISKFVSKIKELSDRDTAQWVEVHGYATPGGDPVWQCSKCGKGRHVYGIEHGSYGADIAGGQWVACPNCGRLMKGEVYE